MISRDFCLFQRSFSLESDNYSVTEEPFLNIFEFLDNLTLTKENMLNWMAFCGIFVILLDLLVF